MSRMLQMLKFMQGTLEDDRHDRQRETGHEILGSIDRGNLTAKAAGKTVQLRMMRRIRGGQISVLCRNCLPLAQ